MPTRSISASGSGSLRPLQAERDQRRTRTTRYGATPFVESSPSNSLENCDSTTHTPPSGSTATVVGAVSMPLKPKLPEAGQRAAETERSDQLARGRS